jgi:hypothetical protein
MLNDFFLHCRLHQGYYYLSLAENESCLFLCSLYLFSTVFFRFSRRKTRAGLCDAWTSNGALEIEREAAFSG